MLLMMIWVWINSNNRNIIDRDNYSKRVIERMNRMWHSRRGWGLVSTIIGNNDCDLLLNMNVR